MKKEEVITIIIMGIIIAIDIITQKNLDKYVDLTSRSLSDIKEKVIQNEQVSDEELEQDTQRTYNEWKERCNELSYFIEHEGMKEVNLNLEKAKIQFKMGEKEEAVAEINEGIYKLNYIKNKQKLNLSNIF